MDNQLDFGKKLREAREKAGRSQRQIADAVGISPQMISAYEKGTRSPSIDVAAKLANEIGVSLDHLCGIQISENSTPTISNCADVVACISELSKYLTCWSTTGVHPRDEEDYEEIYDGFQDSKYSHHHVITSDPVAVVEIENGFIADFFQRWYEIKKLYQKKIIGEDLMDSWYLGEMERLKGIPVLSIPNNIQWFGPEPFKREESNDGND